MSNDHTTTVDRLRQFREGYASSATDRLMEAQKNDADTRGILLAGRCVLDLVTGLDGVILERTAATPTPFGCFAIRLDTGEVVTRFPKNLLARPTPPTV